MDSTKGSGKLQLKTNFAVKDQWEPFYKGGSVVTSDGGNTLLCCCGDSVKVIDIVSGKLKTTLSQDGDEVTCVCSSPDNEIIVSATRSMLLKQWKVQDESNECIRTWKAIHSTPIMSMAFDPTSTLLATGSSDSTIKMWDVIRQYCTHNLRGSRGVVTTVKFHPSELQLFSAADDYIIRVWDLQTSRCICMLDSHVSAITSLAFHSPHEGELRLLSAGRDKLVCVWDLNGITTKNNKLEPSKSVPVYESIEGMRIPSQEDVCRLIGSGAENGVYVVTAGEDGVLKLWNLKTGNCVYPSKEEIEERKGMTHITDLMYLEGVRKYATVTFDHNINLYGVGDGFIEDKHLVGYNDEVLDVKYVGVEDSHVAVATNSNYVKVFELSTSSCQLLAGHKEVVLCVDVFRDGLTLVTGSKDNSVRLWKMDRESGIVTCAAVGRSHTRDVATLAASKLKTNFFASGSHDLTLKIWTVLAETRGSSVETNLKVRHTIKAHDKDINAVSLAPNDKMIATASQDKTAKLWNVGDGQLLGVFRGHKRGLWNCQFSPSDQVLGTSSADGTIKLWLLSDFTCLKTMEGHDCSILKMMFISKGAQIMSSGSDGLVKMWNIKSSECVKTFDGHDDKVWGLAANTDGSVVVSGAADSKIIFWEDITEKEASEAQEVDETVILRQQELNNMMHEKKYAKAFKMAITLEQPFTALKVLKEMKWEEGTPELIQAVIAGLRDDQKDTLLKFIMSWNTNSRNCREAQLVLNHILRVTCPDDFMKFSNAKKAVEALIPYTERHYQRISRLLLNTTFVDYVCQMAKLKPLSSSDINPSAESKNQVKLHRSALPAVHPLKQKPLECRLKKRSRKPDSDPFSNDDVDSEIMTPQKTVSNAESPVKRMRLRSAKKPDVRNRILRK